jgi:Flp pilus assembly protein TadG/uncharacterized protein YegL
MRSFATDRSGTFALMFAITSVPVLIALGCSFDYVQALNAHRRMQTAIDAALVAAVKDVGTDDDNALKLRVTEWVNAAAAPGSTYILNADGVSIDRTKSTIVASVSTTVPTSFLRIVGINQIPVSVKSGVAGGSTVTKSAFSMYLVLDRSGSMKDPTTTSYTTTCYTNNNNKTGAYSCTKVYTKIEALKLAVTNLTTQLAQADPQNKYVRMAAVSYNGSMQTPTPLNWGESAVQTYVSALTPTSSTNSSTAMATAYSALSGTSEDQIHLAKNGVTNPKKYIVFMTDGENTMPNNSSQINVAADTSTKATCDAARTAGITVYTIAFMAPQHGQDLLRYCATTSADYFSAESTADIVNAFSSIGESSSQNLVRLTQ